MASDIDKEEEALRAGMVERCELTLQSRLGMISNKEPIVAIFVHKHFNQKFCHKISINLGEARTIIDCARPAPKTVVAFLVRILPKIGFFRFFFSI